MSTNGLESWAVDLAEIGAVYPFIGWEKLMVLLGVIFWIGWHRIQYVRESAHLDEAARVLDKDKIAKAVERY